MFVNGHTTTMQNEPEPSVICAQTWEYPQGDQLLKFVEGTPVTVWSGLEVKFKGKERMPSADADGLFTNRLLVSKITSLSGPLGDTRNYSPRGEAGQQINLWIIVEKENGLVLSERFMIISKEVNVCAKVCRTRLSRLISQEKPHRPLKLCGFFVWYSRQDLYSKQCVQKNTEET
jgi:hypothetical protein